VHNTSYWQSRRRLGNSGMARLAWFVIPGMPHPITLRWNRRQPTFFNEGDYAAYLELMADFCLEEGDDIWGYCLIPNHTHLIAVPKTEDGLQRAIGESALHAANQLPRKMAWLPLARPIRFLCHGRTVSAGGRAVCRYVELNPVRAKLAGSAAEWRWSSARAHLSGRDDGLAGASPSLRLCKSSVAADKMLDRGTQNSYHNLNVGAQRRSKFLHFSLEKRQRRVFRNREA
jgi:putative transposase